MHSGRELTWYEAAHRKRTKTASLIIFILIPVTIAAGFLLLDDKSYMLVSTAILIFTMVPFFMVFERRKPRAREIVLIAMMTALTVASQLLFHMVLPVQIGTAIVIISGISLGPEAGFLIGALSRFLCNFYMGQGSWTPWEMMCMGCLGFIAGICFNQPSVEKQGDRNFHMVFGPVAAILLAIAAAYISYIIYPGEDENFLGWRIYVFGAVAIVIGTLFQKKRLSYDGITLAAFTFVMAFVLYGGVMNMYMVVTGLGLTGEETMSLDAIRAVYITGMPFDIMHGATAAFCVFLFGDAMIRKLERIKIKYGIYR